MAINRWSEGEVKVALYLYFQLPFGQIHSGNAEIIALSRTLGRTPSAIAMKLANFASLDPKITATGRKGLGGVSALDQQIWTEFNEDWSRLVTDAEMLFPPYPLSPDAVKEDSLAFVYEPFIGPTTASAFVEKRVGQNFFRRAVLTNYDYKCCLTGIAEGRLLNASHILPWSTDITNRHNPKNGLCLSATFDRAFDRGLMSVDQVGLARFSIVLLDGNIETRSFFEPYEGKSLQSAVRFDPDPEFLSWHYKNIYVDRHRHV